MYSIGESNQHFLSRYFIDRACAHNIFSSNKVFRAWMEREGEGLAREYGIDYGAKEGKKFGEGL